MKNKIILVILFLITLSLVAYWINDFKPKPQQLTLILAKKIASECNGNKDAADLCYPQAFASLIKQHDLNFTLATLSVLQDIEPSARGCHLIAHSIAIGETEKNPGNWEKLIGQLDPNTCGGGLTHGVLEAHSRFDTNFKLNAQSLTQICNSLSQESKQMAEESNCDHIMGHLMLVQTSGNIPKAMYECSQVPDQFKFGCSGGVFMENLTRDNLVAHQIESHIPWNRDTASTQADLCKKYSGIMFQGCWREMAHLYTVIANYNPLEVYKLCNQTDDIEANLQCYFHGTGIMLLSPSITNQEIASICQVVPQSEIERCFNEIAFNTLGVSPKYIDKMVLFCNSIDNAYSQSCYSQIGEQLNHLVSVGEKKQLCNQVPFNYQNLCLI